MFYAAQLVSRDGPLQVLWVAATLDRQLNRQLVDGTAIPKVVEVYLTPDAPAGIFSSGPAAAAAGGAGGSGQRRRSAKGASGRDDGGSDGAPLALRLSGQLLLGVCRIYARKVSYLLQDCERALLVLKNICPNDDLLAYGSNDEAEDKETGHHRARQNGTVRHAGDGEGGGGRVVTATAAKGSKRRSAAAAAAAAAAGGGGGIGPDGEPEMPLYDDEEVLLPGGVSQEAIDNQLRREGSGDAADVLLRGASSLLAERAGAEDALGLTTPNGGRSNSTWPDPRVTHMLRNPFSTPWATGGGAGGSGVLYTDPHPAGAEDGHAYFEEMPDHFEFDLDEHEIEALRAASQDLGRALNQAQAQPAEADPFTTPPQPQREGAAAAAAAAEGEGNGGGGGRGGAVEEDIPSGEADGAVVPGRLAFGEEQEEGGGGGLQADGGPGDGEAAPAPSAPPSPTSEADTTAHPDTGARGRDATGVASQDEEEQPREVPLGGQGQEASEDRLSEAAVAAGAATSGGAVSMDAAGTVATAVTAAAAADSECHDDGPMMDHQYDIEEHSGSAAALASAAASGGGGGSLADPETLPGGSGGTGAAAAAAAVPPPQTPPTATTSLRPSRTAVKVPAGGKDDGEGEGEAAGGSGPRRRRRVSAATPATPAAPADGTPRRHMEVDVEKDGRLKTTLPSYAVRELLQDRTPLIDHRRSSALRRRTALSPAPTSTSAPTVHFSTNRGSPWFTTWTNILTLTISTATTGARAPRSRTSKPYTHQPHSPRAALLSEPNPLNLPYHQPLDVASGPAALPAGALAPPLQHLYRFLAGRPGRDYDAAANGEVPPRAAAATATVLGAAAGAAAASGAARPSGAGAGAATASAGAALGSNKRARSNGEAVTSQEALEQEVTVAGESPQPSAGPQPFEGGGGGARAGSQVSHGTADEEQDDEEEGDPASQDLVAPGAELPDLDMADGFLPIGLNGTVSSDSGGGGNGGSLRAGLSEGCPTAGQQDEQQHQEDDEEEEEQEEEETFRIEEDGETVVETEGEEALAATLGGAAEGIHRRHPASDGFTVRTQGVLRKLQAMLSASRASEQQQHTAAGGKGKSAKRRRLEAATATGAATAQVTTAAELLLAVADLADPAGTARRRSSTGPTTTPSEAAAAAAAAKGCRIGAAGADTAKERTPAEAKAEAAADALLASRVTRMAAARTFYDLLVLSNRGFISLTTTNATTDSDDDDDDDAAAAAGAGGGPSKSGRAGVSSSVSRAAELVVVARRWLEGGPQEQQPGPSGAGSQRLS